jgi:hypothetical protein
MSFSAVAEIEAFTLMPNSAFVN